MTISEKARSWDKVMTFLEDDSDLTTEQIRFDLKEQGVDVDAFLKRVSDTVRKGTQYQLRLKAQAEREELKPNVNIAEIHTLTKEKLLEWLKQARDGILGEDYRVVAAACYRNKSGEEQTEKELRSQIIDILAAVQQKERQK